MEAVRDTHLDQRVRRLRGSLAELLLGIGVGESRSEKLEIGFSRDVCQHDLRVTRRKEDYDFLRIVAKAGDRSHFCLGHKP
jgi:hypothetical protein